MAVASGANGRVALITGAAGGIGRAVSEMFIASGAEAAMLDIDIAGMAASEGREVFQCDVTDEASVARALDAVRGRFGRIDYVIHAAGAVGTGSLAGMSLSDWKACLDVNLTSAFLLARECYRDLASSRGLLVFLSSTNGLNGGSALSGPAYASAKAALINLCRYLTKEWGGDGIRVNCVAPGPVETRMLDRLSGVEKERLRAQAALGRIATAEEVAAAIAYLSSPGAISITGTVMNVSAGLVLD